MKKIFKYLPFCVATIPIYYLCSSEKSQPFNLYVWGSGRNGELGLGIQSNCYSPTLSPFIKFSDVSAKRAISAGLTPQGKIYTWGKSRNGILGHQTSNVNILVPKQIEIPDKFKQVSCGYQHMCAVNINGQVYIWGNSQQSTQKFRSISTKEDNKQKNYFKPKKIQGLNNIKQVACSNQHTVALSQQGNVYSWGSKKKIGREGDEKKPLEVNLKNIKKIDCGIDFTIALDNNGKLYSWGSNGYGQLGIPALKNTNQPRLIEYLNNQQIVDISCGDNYVGAISKSGKIYTWGFGNEGQLGHGDKSDQLIPRAMNFQKPIVQIACGSGHTAIISTTNQLFIFGRGREGQIGREGKDESNSSYSLKPKYVQSLRNKLIRKVICGGNHTLALIDQK